MSSEPTLDKIGDIDVPLALKQRWDELVSRNKALKAAVVEAKAAAATVAPELTAAKARIAELEGTMTKAEHARAMAADGVQVDDDLYEYLQYQYGKHTPAEGEDKPDFMAWYATAKESNGVLRAAVAAGGKPATAPTAAQAPKPAPAKTLPPKLPTAAAATFDADNIASLGNDPAAWKANKANVRRALFGQ